MTPQELRDRMLETVSELIEAQQEAASANARHEELERVYAAAHTAELQIAERMADEGDRRYSNESKRKFMAIEALKRNYPDLLPDLHRAAKEKTDKQLRATLLLESLKTYRAAAALLAAELEVEAATASAAMMPRMVTRR